MDALPPRHADSSVVDLDDSGSRRHQAAEAPTAELSRTTVRIEASSSPWEKMRWGIAVVLAVAVTGGGLVLLDSPGSPTSDHVRRPSPRVASPRHSILVGHETPGRRSTVTCSSSQPVAGMRARHPSRRVVGQGVIVDTRGHTVPDVSAPVIVGSPARPPAHEHKRRPRSQFSYLGE